MSYRVFSVTSRNSQKVLKSIRKESLSAVVLHVSALSLSEFKTFYEKIHKLDVWPIFCTEIESVFRFLVRSGDETYLKIPQKYNAKPPKKKKKEDLGGGFFVAPIREKKQSRTIRAQLFFALLTVVLGLTWVFFWISPSATIKLKTRISPLKVSQNVLVALPDAIIPESEENLPIIEGIELVQVMEGKELYPTSGVRYNVQNASGEITLYNNTKENKTFIPSRLSTSTGEIFRFAEEITIPAASGGEPGSIKVALIADELDSDGEPIGRRGNIKAGTTLFFPALTFASRKKFYGKADHGDFTGGETYEEYFLSEDDLNKSQELIKETFKFRALSALRDDVSRAMTQNQEEYILVDDQRALRTDIIDFAAPIESIGKPEDAFEVSGVMEISGIMFRESDVLEVLKKKMQTNRDQDKRILKVDDRSLEFFLQNLEFFEEEGWLKLSFNVTGIQSLDIGTNIESQKSWVESVKDDIQGKSIDEARALLINHPEIEDVIDFQVTPFWTKNIPSIREQIHLEVQHTIYGQ